MMTRVRSLARALGDWGLSLFQDSRYQVMAGMVVVAFVMGDRLFPFSNFPMYGGFPDRTHYVYLADAEGNPLPMHDFFGYRTTKIKRIYSNEMRDIYKSLKAAGGEEDEIELHTMTSEQLRPAGDATLRWLVANDRRKKQRGGHPVPPLRLYHVDIEMGADGRLRRTPKLVGVYAGGSAS